jgi:hypothetical protein
MALKWRFGLVAIVGVAVVGGFVPHGALVGTDTVATELTEMAEVPLFAPVACLDATCGKGNVAPAAPSPGVALAAVFGAAALAALAARTVRRRRPRAASLPTGARLPLDHPPQFF